MELNKKLIVSFPILSGIMWGSSGVFVRTLNEFGFNSISIFTLKLIPSTIILLILLFLFDRKSLKIDLKDLWIFIGAGISGLLLSTICFNEATLNASLSLASILLGLSPIFALIISASFFNEKITSKKVSCLILALIGCLLVSGILEATSSFRWTSWGILSGILSALFWGIYGLFSKIAFEKNYSALTITFYSFLICSIGLAPFTEWGLTGTFITNSIIPNTIFILIYAVLTAILPYFLFNFGLKHMDNGKATILYGGAEPISATIFGALLFSEYPSILNLIGIILTIISLSILVSSNEP